MQAAPTRTFFRIVRHRPPTLDDFMSHKALGRPLRDPTMVREWADGISVYDSLDYAVARVRVARFRLGRFVVPMTVSPGDAQVAFAQKGNDPRHYTLYGPPEALLARVTGPAIEVEV
jgi:hypothetical protein